MLRSSPGFESLVVKDAFLSILDVGPKARKKMTHFRTLILLFFFFFFFKYNRGSVNLWAKTTGSSLKRTLVPYSTFSGDRFSLLDQLDSWLSSA